ncbi:MAG: hypothetical protein HYT12_03115 [Candidatus Liptonbacteria bacterium]|nr:hypothetical protein [Candidatus Liptonbacteria bacterium]
MSKSHAERTQEALAQRITELFSRGNQSQYRVKVKIDVPLIIRGEKIILRGTVLRNDETIFPVTSEPCVHYTLKRGFTTLWARNFTLSKDGTFILTISTYRLKRGQYRILFHFDGENSEEMFQPAGNTFEIIGIREMNEAFEGLSVFGYV